jgi:hypothetical protein
MSTIGTTLKQPRVFAHDAIALSGLDYPINTIATLTIVDAGSNYTAGIVDSEAITGGGSGAEVTITVAGIAPFNVTGATIVGAYDGGINYQVGDQITLSQSGSDENCILQVATITAATSWALGDPITPMPDNFDTVPYWNEKMAYTYTSTAQAGVVKETPGPGAAIYMGVGGNITVINESTTEVTYTGVAAGSFLPVSVLSVVALSGGPTTADVLALF